ncbi:ATP-binding protein [Mesorhizobium sp. M0051]|uniref:ATP-binding protein n=1 Tax=Mesorhizobium sp. M0051 TaxID=2956862 RepID=UPI00333D8E61
MTVRPDLRGPGYFHGKPTSKGLIILTSTLDLLQILDHGMAKGFVGLNAQPEASNLDQGEWFDLLLEQEKTLRQQLRFEHRARTAKVCHTATVRMSLTVPCTQLDHSLLLKIATGDWVRASHNLLITGPCGVERVGLLRPLAIGPAATILPSPPVEIDAR